MDYNVFKQELTVFEDHSQSTTTGKAEMKKVPLEPVTSRIDKGPLGLECFVGEIGRQYATGVQSSGDDDYTESTIEVSMLLAYSIMSRDGSTCRLR